MKNSNHAGTSSKKQLKLHCRLLVRWYYLMYLYCQKHQKMKKWVAIGAVPVLAKAAVAGVVRSDVPALVMEVVLVLVKAVVAGVVLMGVQVHVADMQVNFS